MLKNKNPKIKKDDPCIKKVCVVEKPKKIKKDPIDKIIVDFNRSAKNPPPMFCSLLSRMKK
jgi:hypothetical protein